MSRANVRKDAIEVIPDKFYFYVSRSAGGLRDAAAAGLVLHIDSELLYEPFFADFGPLNAGQTYRFCARANDLLREAESRGVPVIFATLDSPHKKANAAALLGIWLVLYRGASAAQAYAPLRLAEPYQPFRDASCGPSQFDLAIADVLAGVQHARDCGILDWSRRRFDLAKYEHYEQVINGDWNWILPGKFIAVSGPTCRRREPGAYSTLGAEDYVPIFKREGVTAVVRLNKAQYDKGAFTRAGFAFHDLYFPDGTTPPEGILHAFLELAEREPGALAVHCKAGLGRTGTLMCCYMMKHYGFTAEECLGYIRVMRPGSILGPQQAYLKQKQAQMWAAGGVTRATRAAVAAGADGAGASASFFRGMMRNLSLSPSSRSLREGDSAGSSASTATDAPETPPAAALGARRASAAAATAPPRLATASAAAVRRSSPAPATAAAAAVASATAAARRSLARSASVPAAPAPSAAAALRAHKAAAEVDAGGVMTRAKARASHGPAAPAAPPAAGLPSNVRTTAANGQPRKLLGPLVPEDGTLIGEKRLRAFRTMPMKR